MGRRKIPDHELTDEQKKRRQRNERYRKQNVSNLSRLHLVKNIQSERVETEINENKIKLNASQKNNAVSKKRKNSSVLKENKIVSKKEEGILEKKSPVSKSVGKKFEMHLFFKSYFLVGGLIAILSVCCILSFYLQIEAYQSLKLLPDINILGIHLSTMTAGLVEVLLVVLAGLMFGGSGWAERISAGLLFFVIGLGTAALMWHSQETMTDVKVEEISTKNQKKVMNSQAAVTLDQDRRALVEERKLLLSQIDRKNEGSFAAAGAIGLVRDTLARIDKINAELSILDQKIKGLKLSSVSKTTPKEKNVRRTTAFAEGLRVLLLLVTAFLVHTLLLRWKGIKSGAYF